MPGLCLGGLSRFLQKKYYPNQENISAKKMWGVEIFFAKPVGLDLENPIGWVCAAQPYLCFVFYYLVLPKSFYYSTCGFFFLPDGFSFFLWVGKKANAGYTALSCAVGKVAAMSEAQRNGLRTLCWRAAREWSFGWKQRSMRYEGGCDLCCKHKGLAEFLFLCVGLFALATGVGRKANCRYKNCDSPAAQSDPQASINTAAGGLISDWNEWSRNGASEAA